MATVEVRKFKPITASVGSKVSPWGKRCPTGVQALWGPNSLSRDFAAKLLHYKQLIDDDAAASNLGRNLLWDITPFAGFFPSLQILLAA